MRAFLALNIPANIRSNISRLSRELQSFNIKGIKWVKPENYHITIQFIAELKETDLDKLVEDLEREFYDIESIEFTDPHLMIIPSHKPKIIWIEIDTENKIINNIHRRFKKTLISMGYPIDNKTLKFHITLGRVKKRLPDFFVQKILTTELNLKMIEVSEAALYQSILRPEGPLYEIVEKFNFSKE